MLGIIPPRDVLASGTPEDVSEPTRELIDSLEVKSHVILSCGGMPPGVSTENINAFLSVVK